MGCGCSCRVNLPLQATPRSQRYHPHPEKLSNSSEDNMRELSMILHYQREAEMEPFLLDNVVMVPFHSLHGHCFCCQFPSWLTDIVPLELYSSILDDINDVFASCSIRARQKISSHRSSQSEDVADVSSIYMDGVQTIGQYLPQINQKVSSYGISFSVREVDESNAIESLRGTLFWLTIHLSSADDSWSECTGADVTTNPNVSTCPDPIHPRFRRASKKIEISEAIRESNYDEIPVEYID